MEGAASKAAALRRRLGHPVIDADGHWTELFPVFFDYVGDVAGPAVADAVRHRYAHRARPWYEASEHERHRRRMTRPSFWGVPVDAADRAAAAVPRLFYDRLDDWGIDLAIVFPSIGLSLGRYLDDPELTGAVIRAYNVMAADLFRGLSDRLLPAGVVSLADPADAVSQLDHARSQGLRLVVSGGTVTRTVETDAEWQPDPAKRRVYIDSLGLDSPFDYDPVWQRFIELGFPVITHSGSMGWPDRSSPSSFVANHLGHFAQSHHAFARTLFLGGVTDRFPELTFGFLEGGVGWACGLLADLRGHWEKRNTRYMAAHLNPSKLDRDELRRLLAKYAQATARLASRIDSVLEANLDALECDISQDELARRDAQTDEFARVRIHSVADVDRLFARNFFFGCEADDPMTAVAFDDRLGLRLKPVLGSDISHFDVVDPAAVLQEAWELVESSLIDEGDFRAFTFDNAVELYGRMNPAFFAGTVVEAQAGELLARSGSGSRHA